MFGTPVGSTTSGGIWQRITPSRRMCHLGSGADSYEITRGHTGPTNRWHTMDGVTKVVYGDRTEASPSAYLYQPGVNGRQRDYRLPGGHAYVTSTTDDGAFYVYLEDVGRTTDQPM